MARWVIPVLAPTGTPTAEPHSEIHVLSADGVRLDVRLVAEVVVPILELSGWVPFAPVSDSTAAAMFEDELRVTTTLCAPVAGLVSTYWYSHRSVLNCDFCINVAFTLLYAIDVSTSEAVKTAAHNDSTGLEPVTV